MTELAGATSANPVYGPNKPGTIGVPYRGTRSAWSTLRTPTRKCRAANAAN